jgi:aspartate/methionine/tyrosine aminotransferase
LRPDQALSSEAMRNRFDAVTNPAGVIAMNVAENKLCWPELQARIRQACADASPPTWTAGYTHARGNPDVRRTVADFMARHLTGCELDSSRITLTAGASAAIDLLAFVLGDPGDVVAFPAPAYPVYTHDIAARSGLVRHNMVRTQNATATEQAPFPSTQDLDRAMQQAQAEGRRLRMVVLTQPDNPTGRIYAPSALDEICDWCIENEVHLLVNEIYGLSLLDTQHPAIVADYDDPEGFTSFAPILERRASDYLHYCYAFSKDFGLSGFRLGLLYSRNAGVNFALDSLNTSHMSSNLTQWTMQQVLADEDFGSYYVATMRRRLTEAYVQVVTTLREAGVGYTPSRGGLFVWADFSAFLAQDSVEAARDLWLEIYRSCGVLLTPGAGFGHDRNGPLRIVYPGVSQDERAEAMARLLRWAAAR